MFLYYKSQGSKQSSSLKSQTSMTVCVARDLWIYAFPLLLICAQHGPTCFHGHGQTRTSSPVVFGSIILALNVLALHFNRGYVLSQGQTEYTHFVFLQEMFRCLI